MINNYNYIKKIKYIFFYFKAYLRYTRIWYENKIINLRKREIETKLYIIFKIKRIIDISILINFYLARKKIKKNRQYGKK